MPNIIICSNHICRILEITVFPSMLLESFEKKKKHDMADDALYPIAVLSEELKNDDVQVGPCSL